MKKVMLIGDSIRAGYDKYVKMALEDSAEVYYPEENCRFAQYVLRGLGDWRNASKFGDETDCLHWNAGLWDCLILYGEDKLTPLDVYEGFIERICKRIQLLFPKAKVIFATSTPVQEDRYDPATFQRYNRDIEAYNAAAVKIVTKYGFAVNDLYTLLKDAPDSYHSDMTHYYTRKATEVITGQVLQHIQEAIGVEAKEIDYRQFFQETEEEDIVGI